MACGWHAWAKAIADWLSVDCLFGALPNPEEWAWSVGIRTWRRFGAVFRQRKGGRFVGVPFSEELLPNAAYQSCGSRKLSSWRMRVGSRILRRALASIWRTRSRGNFELAADFLEGAAVAVDEAEPLFEHPALTLGEVPGRGRAAGKPGVAEALTLSRRWTLPNRLPDKPFLSNAAKNREAAVSRRRQKVPDRRPLQ